jgi:hypothetical protein
LSSPEFCTEKTAVVIITRAKKVGDLSKSVDSIYVNPNCIRSLLITVENPCGKSCGECGKVKVFNRYFASLDLVLPMWKTLYTGLHNLVQVWFPSCYVTAARKFFPAENVRNC